MSRRNSAPTAAAVAPSGAARWTKVLLVVCLVQFLLLLGLAWAWIAGRLAAPERPTLNPFSLTNAEPYFAGKPGPWGELEYARINIEPTDEFVTEEENALGSTHWFFPGQNREQVLDFTRQLGFTESQQLALRDRSQWQDSPAGVVVLPFGDLIMDLSPEVRTQLYAVLAQSAENNLHSAPFAFRPGGFTDWFENSQLAPATIALVKKVCYQRGAALCVSDAPELCLRIADPSERHRLIKTLSRSTSLLMKLRVRPETDVRQLAAYWGRGWHVKDIEPLLASLTKVPGGMTLDIAHLLPPFARKRLNSFPTPVEVGQRAPDCYWTAWNFFNDPPDDRYFDDAIWRQELQQNCALVEQATFGDLVFLTRPDGVPIHCAVFIADDVVFTKNGANPRQAWKLMKLEDMLARYPEDYPLRVTIFHPKSNSP